MIRIPEYNEENYKIIQGGNVWEDYSQAVHRCQNDEINKMIKDGVYRLYNDSRLSYVNMSNGNTLIIVERAKQGHFTVIVAEGYKETVVEPVDEGEICLHENLIDTGYGVMFQGEIKAMCRCKKCGREIYK